MLPRTLSGRFLILTILFVMLAEVLIFVPSVARYREDYLLLRLERAQIASLTLLADDMIDPALEAELLQNAGVYNVVLHRDDARQLILSSPVPWEVSQTFDLRQAGAFELIRDALSRLTDRENRMIRVIGVPVREAGVEIEVTMQTASLRQAMIDYGLNILLLSAVISLISAGLLYWAVRSILVEPIRRVVSAMQTYAAAPEDASRILVPSSNVTELREAEDALNLLETQLTQALKQKDRLAQLGGAVAKISHDLRNILTVAQLMADRLDVSKDPTVSRAAPKLINSISRAVTLCESTLTYGKAEEAAPDIQPVLLAEIIGDVLEGEALAINRGGVSVSLTHDVARDMVVMADPEQLYRVLSNLVRNARQAIEASGTDGRVWITARLAQTDAVIEVTDTGPGLPPKALDNLFKPFQGGARKGGTGLGLAIAAELVRGHGGELSLAEAPEAGTTFVIRLPQTEIEG